jgi:hypothetical protein
LTKYHSSLVPTKDAKERIDKLVNWEVDEGLNHEECAGRLEVSKFALTQMLHRYTRYYRTMLIKKLESERLRAELLVSGAKTRQYKRLSKIQDTATTALEEILTTGQNEMARVAAIKHAHATVGIGVAKHVPMGSAGKLAEDVVKAIGDTLGIVRKQIEKGSIPSGNVIDAEFLEESAEEEAPMERGSQGESVPPSLESGLQSENS